MPLRLLMDLVKKDKLLVRLQKVFLKKRIEHKMVTIQLFQRDQYSRVVCNTWYKKWFFYNVNASKELLNAGMASMYAGRSPLPATTTKRLLALEERAKASKIGIWSQENYISPTAYKHKK
mmetsp:Transcript_13481/g.14912  ORF Transcript_13481/g.14912 Transcript_13481/m.14912 type:complete len:120 (+) Transcript_13481:33-392(+)